MADPVTASIVQAGLKSAGNFLKDELIKRIFGSIFGGGGSDLPPLTPEQQAALEVSNALNMAQGDLYGDGQNEGFLEIVGPTFEEAVRKVQALDDSEEKTDLLSVLANNAPYDFTDLTPASITGIDSSDYDADVLSNPLLVNPLLVEQAANTGPFVTDPAAGADTLEPTPEQIYEENKKGTIFDLIAKYPTEDGGEYPFDFVVSILKNAADKGNANAAQILSNTPIAGPEGAFDGDGPSAGTGDPAASGAEGTGTPTGGTPQGQTGTPQGETSTPQGSTPTPQGGTPQGGTPTSDTPAVDSPIDTPTVSTGSVLDQTETGNVNVDDQPKGFLTGMTPQAQAIINEGNRIDITATMLGPLIAKQDVPIISPLQFELKNVPQSDFAKALLTSDGQALLTSDGLMRSFV